MVFVRNQLGPETLSGAASAHKGIHLDGGILEIRDEISDKSRQTHI